MAAPEPRRLRITGLHHITIISGSLERTTAFYRDLLGLRLVKRTKNSDDQNARHFFFGDGEGRVGTLITCLEYPRMDKGQVGTGSTHHFALGVESAAELYGWRDYLRTHGVACTDVLDRTYFHSLYLRDPDGHIIELAALGPGVQVDEPLHALGTRMIEPK